MSYCKKKVINYGTVCDFLEQIAQTFENNGVVPFTVTRTNLPYNENVSDTPSVTCDWDNVRIVFGMNGNMNNTSNSSQGPHTNVITTIQVKSRTDDFCNEISTSGNR